MSSPATPAPLHPARRLLRILAWIFGPLAALVVLLLLAVSWYSTTDDFQRRVGGEVVSVLQDSTGGRVELQHISFSLWHLAIQVDGLVIHGTEAPSEMPYLSAAKISVRLRIHTFLTHIQGVGPQSHIGLSYLRIDQPHIHLIVDKDGHTNQPTPKHPTSSEPLQDTLLDLQAGDVELANGLAVLNDRAIPFDLAARNLNAQVRYIRSTDRYGIDVDLADLRTKMATQPEVQSRLRLSAELGRDMAALDSLDFDTAQRTPSCCTSTAPSGRRRPPATSTCTSSACSPAWKASLPARLISSSKDTVVWYRRRWLSSIPASGSGIARPRPRPRCCRLTPTAPPAICSPAP